jgi:hypothetical protein
MSRKVKYSPEERLKIVLGFTGRRFDSRGLPEVWDLSDRVLSIQTVSLEWCFRGVKG